VQIEIEEAVSQPRLQGQIGIVGNEARRAWMVLVEILDDDARFRNRTSSGLVTQHRKLADRPKLQKHRALVRIAEIDELRRERNVVLIQRDQRLPAERRQRMIVERKGHCSLRIGLL